MTTAVFTQAAGRMSAVTVSGHALYADIGEDIVCAGVTSALQLTCNAVTEILGVAADVSVGEAKISLTLPDGTGQAASDFLRALHLHYTLMSEQYPKHITVTVQEG